MPPHPDLPCVLCARERDKPACITVPPSVVLISCVGCGESIYASRSSLELIAAGTAQPICKGCLPAGLIVPWMSGQLKESIEQAIAPRND